MRTFLLLALIATAFAVAGCHHDGDVLVCVVHADDDIEETPCVFNAPPAFAGEPALRIIGNRYAVNGAQYAKIEVQFRDTIHLGYGSGTFAAGGLDIYVEPASAVNVYPTWKGGPLFVGDCDGTPFCLWDAFWSESESRLRMGGLSWDQERDLPREAKEWTTFGSATFGLAPSLGTDAVRFRIADTVDDFEGLSAGMVLRHKGPTAASQPDR